MKPKKVLVIEDDLVMREIVTRKLVTNGFEVLEAENGRVGYEAILERKPDLVLLDLMLPEMDGFQILEAVRHGKDKRAAKTPIIILSNLWSSQDVLKTKALNVQAYLVKAYFTPDEILSKVQEVLNIKTKG
jgi:two-component system, OmpR family, alkaline phosphatase synthesis response regulator PhoP